MRRAVLASVLALVAGRIVPLGTLQEQRRALRPRARPALLERHAAPGAELVAARDGKGTSPTSHNASETNSSAVAKRPGIIARLQNRLATWHTSSLARVLVTCSVYWLAYASWQARRDMLLWSNPMRGMSKQARRASKRAEKAAKQARLKAGPAAEKAAAKLAEGSKIAAGA